MEPIAIATLVINTWKLIKPYAKKIGSKFIEKAGEAMPDAVSKLFDKVKEKMEAQPETESLPTQLVNAPEDEVVQLEFQSELKKLLEKDESFAQQLDKLVKEAKQVTSYSATLHGDGAIAQGQGAKAVGKGGLMVNGNVNGSNLVTGNRNDIKSDKKKKR